jgi:hypothetical protein
VLAQYYDAMFYFANWGSRHLLFRFPAAAVDVAEMQRYSVATDDDPPSEAITVELLGDYVVLGIRLDEEKALVGWTAKAGWIGWWACGRHCFSAIIARCTWRGSKPSPWNTMQIETLWNHRPAGLAVLTPPLQAFVELFDWTPACSKTPPGAAPR